MGSASSSASQAAAVLGSGFCVGNLPGNSIGSASKRRKYQLGDLLGRGAQAKVRLCQDETTGQELAVKVFDRTKKKGAVAFQREVSIWKAFGESPHLMHILDSFTDRYSAYIVMEKYAGHLQAANKHVRAGREGDVLPDAALQSVISQTLSGILHLHNHNIVHRDVKAQNVLVDHMDFRKLGTKAVLSDFGLATPLAAGEFLTKTAGTRKYWPPELFDKKYTHVVDIFALGVLLFLMATGKYPFDEQTVRTRDVFAEGVVPVTLSEEVKQLLRRTLERNPEKRPTALDLANTPWLLLQQESRSSSKKESNNAEVSTDISSETLDHEADSTPDAVGEWNARARGIRDTQVRPCFGDTMEMHNDLESDQSGDEPSDIP